MDISALSQSIELNDGEWVDDIPTLEGVRLKVRSVHYKPAKVAISGTARRNGKKLRTDEGLVSYQVQIGKPLAEHILVDWDLSKAEGFTALTKDGKPLPFSKENALMVLTVDDALGIGDAYRAGVEWASDRVAERIAERAKEVAGN